MQLVDEIRLILKRHSNIRLCLLFGSLAKGTGNSDSDLDLAVDAGRPLTQHEKECLIEELASATGRPNDLIDLFTTGEPLLGQIVTGGKKITGSNDQYADLIYKHLIEQEDFMPLRRRILEERRKVWIGL